MPITKIDLTGADKYIEQTCAHCKYKQRITFGRGAQATKEEPFKLKDGATLLVGVDGGAAQTVTFSSTAFANIATATAAEVVSVLNAALSGARASLDASPDCVVIESTSVNAQSAIAVLGGTASTALGFVYTGEDAASRRPEVGAVDCGQHFLDVIRFRTCHGCGARPGMVSSECVMRTWDTTPNLPEYKHRRVVNALFEWMKANGHVHPDLILDYAAEDQVPPDMLPDIDKSVIETPMP